MLKLILIILVLLPLSVGAQAATDSEKMMKVGESFLYIKNGKINNLEPGDLFVACYMNPGNNIFLFPKDGDLQEASAESRLRRQFYYAYETLATWTLPEGVHSNTRRQFIENLSETDKINCNQTALSQEKMLDRILSLIGTQLPWWQPLFLIPQYPLMVGSDPLSSFRWGREFMKPHCKLLNVANINKKAEHASFFIWDDKAFCQSKSSYINVGAREKTF